MLKEEARRLQIDLPNTDRDNMKMSSIVHESATKEHNTLRTGRMSTINHGTSIDDVIVEPTQPNKVELVNITQK